MERMERGNVDLGDGEPLIGPVLRPVQRGAKDVLPPHHAGDVVKICPCLDAVG